MNGLKEKTKSMTTSKKRSDVINVGMFKDVSQPSVVALIPLHRLGDYENVRSNVMRQDYVNVEFVIVADEGFPVIDFSGKKVRWIEVDNGMSIGSKRNFGIERSSGEIIVHMDADDIYSADWITKSVGALTTISGCLVTGLRKCVFHDTVNDIRYLYDYKGSQGYVVGATMCYRRDLWNVVRFKDMREFEDTDFVSRVGVNIVAHDYFDGFTAILHGNNTASHKSVSFMARI